MLRFSKSTIWPVPHRRFTINETPCRPQKPACMAQLTCWGWQSEYAHAYCKPQPAKYMAIRPFTLNRRATGVVLTPSESGPVTTKANAARRHYFLIIFGSINSTLKSFEYLTRMGLGCDQTMGEWYPISLCKP